MSTARDMGLSVVVALCLSSCVDDDSCTDSACYTTLEVAIVDLPTTGRLHLSVCDGPYCAELALDPGACEEDPGMGAAGFYACRSRDTISAERSQILLGGDLPVPNPVVSATLTSGPGAVILEDSGSPRLSDDETCLGQPCPNRSIVF